MVAPLEERLGAITDGNRELVICGTIKLDYPIVREPTLGMRIEDEGMVPRLGGGGAITAEAAHTLGLQTHLIAALGDTPEIFDRYFQDMQGLTISRTSQGPTPWNIVLQDPVANRDGYLGNTIGAWRSFSKEELWGFTPEEKLSEGTIAKISGYPSLVNIQGEVLGEWLQQFRHNRAITAMDMSNPGNAWENGVLQGLYDHVLPNIDILFANRNELYMLDSETPERPQSRPSVSETQEIAARVLERHDIGTVIVHLSGDGSMGVQKDTGPILVEGLDVLKIQPDKTRWYPTGPGNIFNAHFVYALSYGADIEHALQFANAAAALRLSGKRDYRYPDREMVLYHVQSKYGDPEGPRLRGVGDSR